VRGGGGAFWLPLHRAAPDETLQYHTCFHSVITRISVGFEEAAELGRLPHLTELDLGVNRTLDDEGVAALAGATELRALHLALCSGVHLGWGPLDATRADSGQQSYRAILSRPDDLSPSQSIHSSDQADMVCTKSGRCPAPAPTPAGVPAPDELHC